MSLEQFFKGRSIIVTGAGRGIGRAIAVKLDSLGSTVYAVSKSGDNLSSLKAQCPKIKTIQVDLSDWNSTRSTLEKLGAVDCLVNNAAVLTPGNFMSVTEQVLDSTSKVNLNAVVNVSQIVARKMISAGKPGSIVNISSVAGLKAMPQVTAYSVLKAALDQLTKIMAIELGPHKIRVNSINPGAVPTDMLNSAKSTMLKDNTWDTGYVSRIPMNREMLEMDEVVNSVLFLLSDLVPIMTGVFLPIDGGLCVN